MVFSVFYVSFVSPCTRYKMFITCCRFTCYKWIYFNL